MRDRSVVRNEVVALGLPPIIQRIFGGTTGDRALEQRCGFPFHSISEPNLPPRYVPLWERGIVSTGYDPDSGTFKKISLENPSEPYFQLESFDYVVADLLIDLWEDDVADDKLIEIADAFQFDRAQQLIHALESGAVGDYDSWRHALRTNNSEQIGAG